MSGIAVEPDNLRVTIQEPVDADVEIELSETLIAPTDVHRRLLQPSQSALPARLAEAIGALGPVEGGPTAFVSHLDAQGVDACDGLVAHSIAKLVVQADRGSAGDHWLRLLYFFRHGWNYQQHSLDEIVDAVAALLAQLEHPPTVVVTIPSSFVSDVAQQQRRRVLGYLCRLTPGVDVRITGSRLAIRRLIDHHAADLPADVTERARSALTSDSASPRAPEQVARDAVAQLGLGERQRSYWRLLARVCDHIDGSVPQAALEEDLVVDLDASTVRKYAGRLEDLGLVERPRRNGQTHLRPTAAAQVALQIARDEAPSLVGGWTTGDTPADSGAERCDTAAVMDPPNSSVEPCTPNAHDKEGEANRPTGEGRQAVTGTSSRPPSDCRYLAMHEHHTAAATAPTDGGIALEERQLADRGDDRGVAWSLDEDRDEVVVEVTASTSMALTMLRLCDALLSEKALSQVLTPENLNGGPGKFDLEGLAVSNPHVLRKGRTLGWLRNQDAEGKRFVERLRDARNDLLQQAQEMAEAADGPVYDDEDHATLLREAHGLQGVLVAVYDLLGYDVIRTIRVPDPWSVDQEALAKTLHQQLSISSRYGAYTAHRVLYEDRPEKREDALGTPDVDIDEYRGTVSGSFVVVGPTLSGLRTALEEGPTHLALQENEPNYADFVLEVSVVDGHRREAVAETAARLLPSKNLRLDREIITLLHSLTGSVAAAGAAIDAMGQAEHQRRVDHGDLEYGLATMVREEYYADFDEGDLLPEIGDRTVSAVVAALLTDDTPLSTTDLAQLADVTTQSIRDNREYFERLEALDILDIEDGGQGCPTRWRASFPGAGRDVPKTDEVAVQILGPAPWGAAEWTLEEAIQEVLLRLADEVGQSLGIDFGGEAAQAAFHGPPDERTLQPLVSYHEELRPLVGLVADCLETTLPDGAGEAELRYGRVPEAALTQQTLEAPARAAD